MTKCLFCEKELTDQEKPEHILLNAFGGRKTTTQVICSGHNERFGSTIDKILAEQVTELRNLHGLQSGTRDLPPMLRKVRAGNDIINILGDGTIDLKAKPFAITDLDDGNKQLAINVRSYEELLIYVPRIAGALKFTEEQVWDLLETNLSTNVIRRPDGPAHFHIVMGGEDAVRSLTKSCLELWALLVGNDEVRGDIFAAARYFVLNGGAEFSDLCVRMDSRSLEQQNELERHYGDMFNLIYVRSDDAGRVIGYFRVYNFSAWNIVLAEGGATPNKSIALVSNPSNPVEWSDKISDEIDVGFDWLDAPKTSKDMANVHEKIVSTFRRLDQNASSGQVEKIFREVCDKYGITNTPMNIIDPKVVQQVTSEIAVRIGCHMMNLPYEERPSMKEEVARLRELRARASQQSSDNKKEK